MQYPLVSTVRSGREYCLQWPARAELNSLFIENKIVLLISLLTRLMPILAASCAAFQLWFLGMAYLPQIAAMCLLLLSLPFQLWYWMGIRANTPLPPSLVIWYQQIRQRMQQQGIETAKLNTPGGYRDLALLLQKAYQQLDKTFFREWI